MYSFIDKDIKTCISSAIISIIGDTKLTEVNKPVCLNCAIVDDSTLQTLSIVKLNTKIIHH